LDKASTAAPLLVPSTAAAVDLPPLLLGFVLVAAAVVVDLAVLAVAVLLVAVVPEVAVAAFAEVAAAGALAVVPVEVLSAAAGAAAEAAAGTAAGAGAGACAAVTVPDELDPQAATIRARLAHTGTASTARLIPKVCNVFSFSPTAARRTSVRKPAKP
jgi:hypothetical protein